MASSRLGMSRVPFGPSHPVQRGALARDATGCEEGSRHASAPGKSEIVVGAFGSQEAI